MYNEFLKWLGGAIQFILDALWSVVNALNPITYIVKALDMLVSVLPEPADLGTFYDTYILIFEWLLPSFQLINHFVNLPVFGTAVGFILFVENGINIFRMWRMLRSVVT